jgi:hypothetical protein
MRSLLPAGFGTTRLLALGAAILITLSACGAGGGGSPVATGSGAAEASTPAGDVPDNAVFLTYRDAQAGFSIQYVEGWQVQPSSDGVTIHDKDSSETVAILPLPPDVGSWVRSTDLPALQGEAGFALIGRDTVAIGGASVIHLAYHQLSPPDPVTDKRVASTVDRYYVPGAGGLAVVTLSTPDGVDNVDAFRQMIDSFAWA